MSAFVERLRSEPVLFQGIIQAAIGLMMSYGFHVTVEQMGSVLTLTAAILSFWARARVSPMPATVPEESKAATNKP